jgi:hypothetical protein
VNTRLSVYVFVVAEVMDKEPTLATLWATAGVIALAGVAAARLRWWLAALPTLVGAVFAQGVLVELYDPYVGPAILREAGRSYVLGGHAASVVALIVPIGAAYVGRRKLASARTRTSDAS